MSSDGDIERFLEEAQKQALITADAAAKCRRIAEDLAAMGQPLPIHEIAVRRGFMSKEEADGVVRAITGRIIGRYRIMDQIGSGAMGVVWRARDVETGAVVALKILSRDAIGVEAVRERFLREARVARTLDHPNIVRGLDSGEAAATLYFAMEFVAGESLEQRLERGALPEKEAFGIARDVVRALEYVRQFDLVHRDIKPGNLLLSVDGKVKLCDLGLTRPSLAEAKELGMEERAIGTPAYVSPEQIERPDSIDWRADQYSLGATLYHAITGTPPFTGTSAEITKKQVETAPRDPREHVLSITEGAAGVVLKMLHKDPTRRYASLADLAADLESVRDGTPPVNVLSAAPVPARTSHRAHAHSAQSDHAHAAPRKKSNAGVVIAVVALLAIGGVVFAVASGGKKPVEPPKPGSTPADAPAGGNVPVTNPAGRGDAPPPDSSGPVETSSGRDELAAALAYRKDHPEDWAEGRFKLDNVARRFADQPSGAEAKAALAKLEEARGQAALKDLEDRAARALAAEQAGKLRDAWKEFREFPAVYKDLPAGQRAAAEAARLGNAAKTTAEKSIADARRAADEKRFAEARKALAVAALAAPPESDADLSFARTYVDSAEQAHTRARETQRAAYEETWGVALVLAAQEDADSARQLVQGDIEAAGVYKADLEALLADLQGIARVQDAARKAWSGKTGEKVKLAAPQRPSGTISGTADGVAEGRLRLKAGAVPIELALRDLAAAEVLDLAAKSLDRKSAADQRAAFHYALARGDAARARANAELAALAGSPIPESSALVERIRPRIRGRATEAVRRSELARMQKALPEAREAAEDALRLVPDDAYAAAALAGALVEAGQWDEARAISERAIALPGAPPAAFLRMAQVHQQKSEIEKAATNYRVYLASASKDDPPRADAEKALEEITAKLGKVVVDKVRKDANLQFSRDKWADAATGYEQILTILPDDPEAAWRLGKCYLKMGRVFPAYRRLTMFVRDHGKHTKVGEAVKDLGTLDKFRATNDEDRRRIEEAKKAQEGGYWDDAIDKFKAVVAQKPFYEEAYLGLGQSLVGRSRRAASRDDLHAAVKALDDLLFLHDDFPEALTTRSEAYLALGEFDRAVADAERALVGDKVHAAPALTAANAHLGAGRLDEAGAMFDEAFKREPSAEALYGRGLVLERRGRATAALGAFHEALEKVKEEGPLRKSIEEAIARLAPDRE